MKAFRTRWPALAMVLFAAVACRGETGESTSFDGEKAMEYASAQLAFGPRIPGTAAATKAGDWIVSEMEKRADTVMVQTWTHQTEDGKQLPMRNILARFNPHATQRILYVTHWDTRPRSDGAESPADRLLPVPGANDGASGVAMFMALGDALKKNPVTAGVDLLFVDGEDYGQFDEKLADVLIGAAFFVKNPPEPGYRPIFGVLWDMIGDRDLRFLREGYSLEQAPEVVERVWSKAAELGYASVFVQTDTGGITDDHVPFLKAGYRMIDVIDLEYPDHHRPTDTIDKISAKSLSIVGAVAEALLR
ncbi:MAG: M28 family peptidase [Gemmatimonadaceae bacterium]